MAAVSADLDNGGVGEPEINEEPEQKNNVAVMEALAPPAVPWPAAVAKRYERREKIGEGMFGEVYKAYDRVSESIVAVKRLSTRTDNRFVETPLCYFEREVESLTMCCRSPYIVLLLDKYTDSHADGDRFIVMEYAGSMNLRQYMDIRRLNSQPFDEDEVRDVMAQLLAATSHAHNKAGILHRDIVPENVIVDTDDVVSRDMDPHRPRTVYRVCGFGMSEPTARAEKDESGMLASPSPYRAPELFLGSKDYDGRVDTWSLGCIMAELIDGTGVPFFGDTHDSKVFDKMMQAVGTRGIVKWQGFERVASPEKMASLQHKGRRERGCLHKMFRSKVLSPDGFKVLKGLLHSNPDRRLSAAAALSMPWFQRRSSFFGACFMPRGAA